VAADGKIAIVTGGGRGIGRSMALGLAKAGHSVVVTAASSHAEIEAVAAEAAALDGAGPVRPMVADVADPAACMRVVSEAVAAFGGVDILVNNAALGMRLVSDGFLEEITPFWRTDPDVWRRIVDANVNGPFYMARAVMPHLLERGWGRIVNVTVNAATMRRPGFSPYGPSKAALESETVIWAGESGGTGITVNCLLPGGPVRTGMIPDRADGQHREGLLEPGIVVPALLWLVSEDADGATGGRYIATNWDKTLPPHLAAEKARVPAGWPANGL